MAVTTSTYHVFLSFRGEDTRHGFTGNLYKALDDKEIRTFIDDEKLQRGEEITPALMKAIEDSRIAITVLSEDYASSSFCLDELATILDAQRKGMLVIPVFYKVDPSDVRHLKGTYEKALAKLEEKFKAKEENMDKLQKWKEALRQVANLSGFHFKDGDGYEYKFIEKIVEEVSRVINRVPLRVAAYRVGLESRVLEVRKLLDVRSDDGVCMIGIHGMGGIGKSTLARAVYNDLTIAEKFDGLCFLENVREKSNTKGLEHLQSILLSEILRQKDINLTSWQQGASMIQDRLQGKKLLLVLDDVDEPRQLQAIAEGRDWFGPGSIIIITTRDKQLLESHQVNGIYKVKELNKNHALQLLTWKAFKSGKADPMYEGVLHRVVTYASGLPLALEVIGSFLFGKSIQDWESAIKKYKRIPENDILKILKVSFDDLGEEEKSVFLDIACCFKGYKLSEVENILHAHYGDCMKCNISVLAEKSLVKLDYSNDEVTLHELIEHMGKVIVRQGSPTKPEKRSRLWSREDIVEVLEENTGTSEIKMICLDFPKFSKEIVEWDENAFKKMQELRTLIIKNGTFSKGPEDLPNSLRVLEWEGYPSNCLPSGFQPKKLVICKLPNSLLKSFDSSKKFVNLTVLNFDYCKYLTEIPDVSGFQNLEKLSFECCDQLVKVHKSIGYLHKLKQLSAFGCDKLESFPAIHLTSLEKLELSSCSSLEYFPEILGKMKKLRKLRLWDTPIKELPFSFQYLIGLQDLSLENCGTVLFPSSIAVMMPKLISFEALSLKGWKWIKQEEDEENVDSIVSPKVQGLVVPGCNLNDDFFSIGFMRFAGVQYLNLSENNFTSLPECIKEFHSLKRLSVSNCKHLLEIRGVPPSLTHVFAKNCTSLTSTSTTMFINKGLHVAQIFHFCLAGAWIPKWIGHQRKGPSCSFWFRNKFPAKILCLLITPVKVKAKLGRYAVHPPMVFINGIVRKSFFDPYTSKVSMLELDHTYLFNLQYKIYFSYDMLQVTWKNKWNHVEITYEGVLESSLVKATGIHVFKQENGKEEDIRFDDPCSNAKVDYHPNSSESRNQPLKSIEKEWNHVEITYEGVLESSRVKATGIHVFKEESNMDDIPYDDPYSNTKVDGYLNTLESQNHSLPKSIGFMWFAYVKEINLRNNNFTILPECMKECQFLSYLDVSDCKHLQEIRGIPPNLQYFFAKNCKSLISSSISMFLNQDLHEAPKTQFCLPGARIPEWFDHQSSGPSTSFWFRNKFSDKVLSLVIAPVEDENGFSSPIPMVFINGKVHESLFHSNKKRVRMEMDHTYLSDIQLMHFNDNLLEVPFEKEWNHVVVTYAGVLETSLVKATGIHVFKQESSMDNIRFDDPYSNTKVDNDVNSSESQNHQLLKKHRFEDMEVSSTQFVQQQKCIVSWSSLLNPSCSYFHLFLLKQSSHCTIM